MSADKSPSRTIDGQFGGCLHITGEMFIEPRLLLLYEHPRNSEVSDEEEIALAEINDSEPSSDSEESDSSEDSISDNEGDVSDSLLDMSDTDGENATMKVMSGIRWAFRCGVWKPTEDQWTLAARCVQTEEKKRIGKFVFKKDAKSAMVGRLLLRKVICDTLHIPYDEIHLDRSEKGKPFLRNEVRTKLPNFNFNVSHQGVYAVLAAEGQHQVGVDVMQIDYARANEGTVKKFFDTMSRQFTSKEWSLIKVTEDEYEQLSRFYRFWCLKESYVKALGVGIGFDLQRISFHTPTSMLKPGAISTDTQVYVDGVLEADWSFEETMLDRSHYVAVALQHRDEQGQPIKVMTTNGQSVQAESVPAPPPFQVLEFEELMNSARPLSGPDKVYWNNFKSKAERPGQR